MRSWPNESNRQTIVELTSCSARLAIEHGTFAARFQPLMPGVSPPAVDESPVAQA